MILKNFESSFLIFKTVKNYQIYNYKKVYKSIAFLMRTVIIRNRVLKEVKNHGFQKITRLITS